MDWCCGKLDTCQDTEIGHVKADTRVLVLRDDDHRVTDADVLLEAVVADDDWTAPDDRETFKVRSGAICYGDESGYLISHDAIGRLTFLPAVQIAPGITEVRSKAGEVPPCPTCNERG